MLPELKINPVVEQIQNDRNKLTQHVRRMDRQTATLGYEIWPIWETKPRTGPENTRTCRHLMRPEQFTRPKTLQAI